MTESISLKDLEKWTGEEYKSNLNWDFDEITDKNHIKITFEPHRHPASESDVIGIIIRETFERGFMTLDCGENPDTGIHYVEIAK